MPSRTPITDRILDELQSMPGCDLDTLTKNLPDLSWSQIFLEVDPAKPRGHGPGDVRPRASLYMIRLPGYKPESAPHRIQP